MKMNIYDLIGTVANDPMHIDTSSKYRNSVELSGFLLRKPKFITHDKTGVTSCSMVIYQIIPREGGFNVCVYSCMVYYEELIEQLKKQDKVAFVAITGKVRHSKKIKGMYIQVANMATAFELEYDLTDEYQQGEAL